MARGRENRCIKRKKIEKQQREKEMSIVIANDGSHLSLGGNAFGSKPWTSQRERVSSGARNSGEQGENIFITQLLLESKLSGNFSLVLLVQRVLYGRTKPVFYC